MDNKIISKLVDFSIPEGMREMTEEENAKFFACKHEGNYGIRNEENHTMIAISVKKRPLLIGRAVTLDAELKATEKKIIPRMPSYENLGYFEKVIGGQSFLGFKFSYVVQDIKQVAEYYLYRTRDYFCAFELLCGEAYQEYANEKFGEFLESVKIK